MRYSDFGVDVIPGMAAKMAALMGPMNKPLQSGGAMPIFKPTPATTVTAQPVTDPNSGAQATAVTVTDTTSGASSTAIVPAATAVALPAAATSSNYLLYGAIVVGLLGVGYLMFGKKRAA